MSQREQTTTNKEEVIADTRIYNKGEWVVGAIAASRRVLQRQKVISWRVRDFHRQGIHI
jgi:hypothetical protein